MICNVNIISFSLGSTRLFELKSIYNDKNKYGIYLENGSILTMENEFQTYYKHRIPIDNSCNGFRINLTFRWIKTHSNNCIIHNNI